MARNLYQKAVDLYRNGVLRQYYVEDEDAIRIVSLMTGLSEEELVQIAEQRNSKIRESFSQASKIVADAIQREIEEPENEKPIAVREEDLFGRAIQELLNKKKKDDENNKTI